MDTCGFKACPFCKEQIRATAIKCRFCGEWLDERPQVEPVQLQNVADAALAPQPPPIPEPTNRRKGNVPIHDAARGPLCASTSRDHEASNRRKQADVSVSEILFSFQGRISRRTFWAVWATMMASTLVVGLIISATVGENGEAAAGLQLLWSIPLVWIMLAVQVKRWHDLNKSGWMILIGLIPIAGILIALAFLGFVAGTTGPNNYGNDPLRVGIEQESTTAEARKT